MQKVEEVKTLILITGKQLAISAGLHIIQDVLRGYSRLHQGELLTLAGGLN
jgi:hypothetical protein